MVRSLLLAAALVSGVMRCGCVSAFERKTHAEIRRLAIDRGGVDVAGAFTDDALHYPAGLNSLIQESCMSSPCTPRHLIVEGSRREDDGINFFNHFHDPTTGSWETAGLDVGESALLWQQDERQAHSWQAARRNYLSALIATDQEAEREYLSRAMIVLGHVVHLVQDAVTPAHTRDDWHLPADPDYFHQWAVDDNKGQQTLEEVWNNPPEPDPVLLSRPVALASGSRLAPIASLIDSAEAGRSPVGCGNDIGVAEYSNARFMSDDTVFDRAMPSVSEMRVVAQTGPTGQLRNYYHFINGCDAYDYRVAATTSLYDYLTPLGLTVASGSVHDDKVMEDYGTMLFPRAVSYSAAILKYFFRSVRSESGELQVQEAGVCHPCPECQEYSPGTMPAYVWYAGPAGSDEPGAGTVYAVARPSGATGGYVRAEPVDITLTREPQLITLSFNGGLAFVYPGWPEGLCWGQVRVACQGQLGAEPNAVIGHWASWGGYGGM